MNLNHLPPPPPSTSSRKMTAVNKAWELGYKYGTLFNGWLTVLSVREMAYIYKSGRLCSCILSFKMEQRDCKTERTIHEEENSQLALRSQGQT